MLKSITSYIYKKIFILYNKDLKEIKNKLLYEINNDDTNPIFIITVIKLLLTQYTNLIFDNQNIICSKKIIEPWATQKRIYMNDITFAFDKVNYSNNIHLSIYRVGSFKNFYRGTFNHFILSKLSLEELKNLYEKLLFGTI